jgi:hypothetical protein
MSSRVWLLALLLPFAARAEGAWEVNGIRLEPAQVERLADDLAARTLDAVVANVAGIDLREPQRDRMRAIYRTTALEVYGRVIPVVQDDALAEDVKRARVRELVLEGQRKSHDQIAEVLDADQLDAYSTWEQVQVEAFQSRRLDRRRRGSR